jgi:hypothetical protein
MIFAASPPEGCPTEILHLPFSKVNCNISAKTTLYTALFYDIWSMPLGQKFVHVVVEQGMSLQPQLPPVLRARQPPAQQPLCQQVAASTTAGSVMPCDSYY